MANSRLAVPTVLSVFSGLGGLDLGLERAGFSHVGLIELDDFARRSLKANRSGEWPLLESGDVFEVADRFTPSMVGMRPGDLTILAGGPPCQPFSKAAQWSSSSRAGLDDHRAKTVDGFLTLVRDFLPELVFIENVPGFCHGSTSALPMIEREINLINKTHGTSYLTQHKVVNSADFGVPQRRRRAIVILRRDGTVFEWPAPTHAGSSVSAWDAIGGDQDLGEDPMPTLQGKWAGLVPSIPEGRNYQWHTDRGGGEPLFGYRTKYWSFLLKLAKAKPSWTIAAQPGPATGPFHWSNRPLTTAEMLRLQSFPLGWRVEGVSRQRTRQVGNATPPLLAEVFGRSIAAQLGFESARTGLTLSIPQRDPIPDPEVPDSVTSVYLGLKGQHPAHPGAGEGPNPRELQNAEIDLRSDVTS